MKPDSKLKIRRKELGLTLKQVADQVGVGESTVRKWETGLIENMKTDKIELLSKALKMNPLEIIGMDFKEDKGTAELNKKEKFEYDRFMEEAIYFFNDENVSDEDKKKLSDSLQEVFFTALLEKKKKK